MTEAHLSMEPKAGMCVALHVLPAGVSYHIRACVPCVCTVSGCSALRRVQICLSPRSPEASSWRRPSVCFVLTSPLLTIPKRPLLSEWGGRYVMAFETQCSARTGSQVCFYFKPALNINSLVNLPWRQCTPGKNPNGMKGGRSALHTVYRRSHVKTTHCQNLVLMNF